MTKQCLRKAYGKYIAELAKTNKKIVAMEADLKESTQSVQFEQAYPKRYIECGIAEQNMVGVASGLALEGKIPIVHSFACFISMRACEQVRTSVAYSKANVKFVVSHAGVSAGTAGTTHHAIEDIAIMRAMPNMTVIVPGYIKEAEEAIVEAIKHKGPVYIRLSAYDVENDYGPSEKFKIGKATELRKGDDLTIITTGVMVDEGIKACDILLKEHSVKARLLHMASIKPIDSEAIIRAACETGKIITIEEHNQIGGLGSAVCEVVAQIDKGVVTRIGIDDHFCGFCSSLPALKREGLNADAIVYKILSIIKKNNFTINNIADKTRQII